LIMLRFFARLFGRRSEPVAEESSVLDRLQSRCVLLVVRHERLHGRGEARPVTRIDAAVPQAAPAPAVHRSVSAQTRTGLPETRKREILERIRERLTLPKTTVPPASNEPSE
jgi:hypothetical protein